MENRTEALDLIMDFYGEISGMKENYNKEDIINKDSYMYSKHFMTALKCTLIYIEKQIETLLKVKQMFSDLHGDLLVQAQIDKLKLIRYEIITISIKIRSKND